MKNEINEIQKSVLTNDYIKDIKAILAQAKKQSYKSVNSIMIQAYWLVGWRIVEQEQQGKKRAGYGEKIIENLSKALNDELGSGMSEAHLKNCRQFFLTFSEKQIRYTLCSELSWSVRELERNIKTNMYHRVLKNQIEETTTNKKLSEKSKQSQIKDPYILEFLGIKPEIKYSEKKLENAIISHLEKFLLEMGKGFSFVERQMHIKTETQDFYIDLVFYNYILKCFVLIDLKKGSLKHQDIGQMDMYVRMFDSLKKADDDNPTIGIIFCADKDESVVKYSVLSESEQIFASKYKTVLPTEEELSAELDRNRRFLEEKSGAEK